MTPITLFRCPAIAILPLLAAPVVTQGQEQPWLRAAIGLDTVRAPVADWVVTDSATRETLLTIFAPAGPWEERYGELTRLPSWPSTALVLDFSGDGVPDLVTRSGDGWATAYLSEGRLVFIPDYGANQPAKFRLYQWLDDGLVMVGGEFDGALIKMSRPHAWSPAHLGVSYSETHNDWAVSHLAPVVRGDTLDYRRATDVLPVPVSSSPDEIFAAPRPFVVENEVYTLRWSPAIDPPGSGNFSPMSFFYFSPAVRAMEEWPERVGNQVAVYARGAHGVALAASEDDTGRVWWYVVMSPTTPPVEPRFDSAVSLSGWMSSRFLREIVAPREPD